jgi:hypothetical protein
MPLPQNPLQSSFFSDSGAREERRERDGESGTDRKSNGQLVVDIILESGYIHVDTLGEGVYPCVHRQIHTAIWLDIYIYRCTCICIYR